MGNGKSTVGFLFVLLITVCICSALLHNEVISQTEEKIEAGWQVSVNGTIVDEPVDLNEYEIKIDEKSETVILTTKDRDSTYFIPIFYSH